MNLTTILQYGLSGDGMGLLIFYSFVLITLVALVLWTYDDATKNSHQSPHLWAAVVLFAPVLGFALYLLLGRSTG